MIFHKIVLLLFFATSLVSGLALKPTCDKVCVRKEIHDWTEPEWINFADALTKYNRKDANGFSDFDRFVGRHLDFMMQEAHGSALFLPWHRAFLYELEQDLKRHNSNVCLPYLDWSRIYSQLGSSSIWNYLGRCHTFGGCVTGGLFANFGVKYTKNQVPIPGQSGQFCITRNFTTTIKDMPSVESVAEMIKTSNFDFVSFSKAWESLHAYLHINVGGDMNSGMSPSDPLFLLHHGYIDQVWDTFQAHQAANGNGRQIVFGGLRRDNKTQCTLETMIEPFNIRVKDLMDNSKLCVKYARPGEWIEPVRTTVPPTATTTLTPKASETTTANVVTKTTKAPTVTTTTKPVVATTTSTLLNETATATETGSKPSSTATSTTSSDSESNSKTTTDSPIYKSTDSAPLAATTTSTNRKPTTTSSSYDDNDNSEDSKSGEGYLPPNYKPPSKPLDPLPYSWIKLNYKINDKVVTPENYLQTLPENLKSIATCGQKISEKVIEKVKNNETISLPPLPEYNLNGNNSKTGTDSAAFNTHMFTASAEKNFASVGLLMIVLPLLF